MAIKKITFEKVGSDWQMTLDDGNGTTKSEPILGKSYQAIMNEGKTIELSSAELPTDNQLYDTKKFRLTNSTAHSQELIEQYRVSIGEFKPLIDFWSIHGFNAIGTADISDVGTDPKNPTLGIRQYFFIPEHGDNSIKDRVFFSMLSNEIGVLTTVFGSGGMQIRNIP